MFYKIFRAVPGLLLVENVKNVARVSRKFRTATASERPNFLVISTMLKIFAKIPSLISFS